MLKMALGLGIMAIGLSACTSVPYDHTTYYSYDGYHSQDYYDYYYGLDRPYPPGFRPAPPPGHGKPPEHGHKPPPGQKPPPGVRPPPHVRPPMGGMPPPMRPRPQPRR